MRLLILLLPLFLNAKIFKVANYNVENLFDLVKQGREYKEYIPNTTSWNKKLLDTKLNHTAQVICDIEADIIGLEEIENKNALLLLQNRLKKVGCGYRYSSITHKLGSTIQVALLSKYKIISSKDIKVSYSDRNILETEIEIDKKRVKIFVNHWKSMGRNGVESKRIKSAKALENRIKMLPNGSEYIILGDFNSDYNAYTTLDEKLDDTNGKRGINHTLHTTINNRLLTQSDIIKAKRGYHYNLWLELDSYNRWSYNFFGKKGTLDNIIVAQNMFDKKGIEYVDNSFNVFKAPYLFTKKGYIKRWRYKGYSDHLPIYALFSTDNIIKKEITATKVIKQKSEKSKIKKETILKKTINNLYTMSRLKEKVKLENVVVVLKRDNVAIIKQTSYGRGIYLFGCVSDLREGYRYDLIVDKIKSYNGLKEITKIEIIKEKGSSSLYSFYKKKISNIRQSEVIKDVEGTYDNNYFSTKRGKISIYFKNRSDRPKNKTKIKIKYGHIGYYNRLSLVIYNKKDFEIRRK